MVRAFWGDPRKASTLGVTGTRTRPSQKLEISHQEQRLECNGSDDNRAEPTIANYTFPAQSITLFVIPQ